MRSVISFLVLAASCMAATVHVKDFNGSIQSAINSGAGEVVVDYRAEPYLQAVPIELRDNLTLQFDPGVVVEAAVGGMLAKVDSLLWCERKTNIRIVAHGVTFRMRQADYKLPPYEPSEHRHGLGMRGCVGLMMEGGTIENTGGDGIYMGPTWDDERVPCKNIVIIGTVIDGTYRNGVSFVSAIHCLLRGVVIKRAGVAGVNPRTGIDFEPSSPKDWMVGVKVENCQIIDSGYSGIAAPIQRFTDKSPPVSIEVTNTLIQGGCEDSAMQFGSNVVGPDGYINLDVTIRDTKNGKVKTHLWKSTTCGLGLKVKP